MAGREDEARALLGEREQLHRVLNASGGHLRDIFIILRQVITTAYGRGLALPISEDHVEDALNSVALQGANATSALTKLNEQVAAAQE